MSRAEGYRALRIQIDGGIAFATIDHPPINLLDGTLIVELDRFGREVEADPDVRVVVIDSANPEFFIAHADVNLILRLPREPQPPPTELTLFHAMADRFRTMPKATIAIIEGRARGGGSELALAMDMRFAARGKAVLAKPELGVGIIPGGGGTQRLTHLVGRARALEIILGCNDIDAARPGAPIRAEGYDRGGGHANATLPRVGGQTREFELDGYDPDQPGES